MIYLGNAFSLSMMRYPVIGVPKDIRVERISALEAGTLLRSRHFYSVYGHRDTACHLAKYLHLYIPVRRETIELTPEDVLIVAKADVRRADYLVDRRRGPKWSFYRVSLQEDEKQGKNKNL